MDSILGPGYRHQGRFDETSSLLLLSGSLAFAQEWPAYGGDPREGSVSARKPYESGLWLLTFPDIEREARVGLLKEGSGHGPFRRSRTVQERFLPAAGPPGRVELSNPITFARG